MIKIILIIISFSLLISKQSFLAKAEECALNTECKHISRCPRIKNNFHVITRKPYCNSNQNSTYVCCLVPQPKYNQEKDHSIRSVRECKSYKNLRSSCEAPLIVAGEKADPKEYPFMALLYFKNGDDIRYLCGGTLISKKFVLTAAHCFFGSKIPNMVRLGELDYATSDDDARPENFLIKHYITHPQYYTTETETKYNDIALVELNSEVTYNDYIMPACLPLVDGREFDHYYAAGWGNTYDTARNPSSHLLKVKLDRFDDSTCVEKTNITEELNLGVNKRTQMCAGSFNDTRDTCQGDSGGPLFVDHPDKGFECLFLVLGITSFGDGGCGKAGTPAVYTRITLYLDWIEQIVWNEPARLW